MRKKPLDLVAYSNLIDLLTVKGCRKFLIKVEDLEVRDMIYRRIQLLQRGY